MVGTHHFHPFKKIGWPWSSGELISGQNLSGWWFQPIWKIWVKLEIFPNFRGENQKSLKPPPSYIPFVPWDPPFAPPVDNPIMERGTCRPGGQEALYGMMGGTNTSSIKNWMGPYQWTPKLRSSFIRHSGFFRGSVQWEISWTLATKFGRIGEFC